MASDKSLYLKGESRKFSHPADAYVDKEQYVDIAEAMQILDRCKLRVRAYIKDGKLPSAHKVRGKIFILRSEVEALSTQLVARQQASSEQRRKRQAAKIRQACNVIARIVSYDKTLSQDEKSALLRLLDDYAETYGSV